MSCQVERRRDVAPSAGLSFGAAGSVGAFHGENALPARWRDSLLGRTGTDDDGRVQALLELAVERFAA